MKEIVLRTDEGFLIDLRDQQPGSAMQLKIGTDGSMPVYTSRKNVELLHRTLGEFLERS
jgi:hypothetical protein